MDLSIVNQITELLTKDLTSFHFEPRLLHGDLGIYNILVNNSNKLVGIIDPYPIVGDSLYDLLFFVVSSENLISSFRLDVLETITKAPRKKIILLLLPILLNRIARQLKNKKDATNFLDLFYHLLHYYTITFFLP